MKKIEKRNNLLNKISKDRKKRLNNFTHLSTIINKLENMI